MLPPDSGRAAVTGKLSTVAAAWPIAVSRLAQVIDACQRCEIREGCSEWLAESPESTVVPPPFCPNANANANAAAADTGVRQAKERR